MFKDCFGRPLRDGDDVIVSIENVLYSGIVMKELDSIIIIFYNYWEEGKEKEHDLQYGLTDLVKGKLMNIYRI